MKRMRWGAALTCATAVVTVAITVFLLTSPSPSTPKPTDAVSEEALGYGSVTGQFVLEGEVPPRESFQDRIEHSPDRECCRKGALSDALLVDEKTHGIANVCVFVSRPATVHPRLKAVPGPVSLTEKDCRYFPHVLKVRVGQLVRRVSEDRCLHRILDPLEQGLAASPADPRGQWTERIVKCPDRGPVRVGCRIHTWMAGVWLVLDHPYGAVTDAEGNFTVADLPSGDHKLRIWHEQANYLDEGLPVSVRPNETTDLGVIRIPGERFSG